MAVSGVFKCLAYTFEILEDSITDHLAIEVGIHREIDCRVGWLTNTPGAGDSAVAIQYSALEIEVLNLSTTVLVYDCYGQASLGERLGLFATQLFFRLASGAGIVAKNELYAGGRQTSG
ncbi:hypothetical protein D9M70_466620 [compost metagenome]